MMLVLAVRTDAERVYQRALAYFTPDEIAEAFAAARGIASPTQLRIGDEAGRARPRRPVPRPGTGAAADLAAAVGVQAGAPRRRPGRGPRARRVFVYSMFTPAELPISAEPTCGTDDVMILMAQAVPTATAVPCLAALPAGWEVGGVQIEARPRFSSTRQAGDHAVEVTLRPPDACAVDGGDGGASDEAGMRRFEAPEQLPPAAARRADVRVRGGCVTYRFEFDGDGDASLIHDARRRAGVPAAGRARRRGRRALGRSRLCGAGAPPCAGED